MSTLADKVEQARMHLEALERVSVRIATHDDHTSGLAVAGEYALQNSNLRVSPARLLDACDAYLEWGERTEGDFERVLRYHRGLQKVYEGREIPGSDGVSVVD